MRLELRNFTRKINICVLHLLNDHPTLGAIGLRMGVMRSVCTEGEEAFYPAHLFARCRCKSRLRKAFADVGDSL